MKCHRCFDIRGFRTWRVSGNIQKALKKQWEGVLDQNVHSKLGGRVPASLRDRSQIRVYSCFIAEISQIRDISAADPVVDPKASQSLRVTEHTTYNKVMRPVKQDDFNYTVTLIKLFSHHSNRTLHLT